MYELQTPKLPRMFESLPDSVAAALEIMTSESPNKAVVEPDERGQVVKSSPYPEMPASSLMKKKCLLRQAHIGAWIVVALTWPFHVRRSQGR